MRWAVLASALLVLASTTLNDTQAQRQTGSHPDSARHHRQPAANSAPQDQEQTSSQKKLQELDEALAKRLKGICRGC